MKDSQNPANPVHQENPADQAAPAAGEKGGLKGFLARKNIVFSAQRYGIDALGAMAQGLFASLLIGTIINTVGTQFGIAFLTQPVAVIAGTEYTVGGLASAMSGPAMACAIGYALQAPPLVLFSMVTVGFAANALGGAGGPLAVLFVAILSAELGKAVSKETKVDILVTPLVTIFAGILLSAMSGPAMACAIGYALQAPPLVLFSMVTVGFAANALGGAGGPLAVLFVAILSAELGKAVSKETKVDILVTPLVTIFAGILLSALCAPAIGSAASSVGRIIMWATELQPFFMGIIVSVIIGMALTLPISSAAICAALGLTGLAGGAAVAGCCAQMVGFAVMSWRENGVGGLVSQGLGTSMLQMGNIVKNPRIWIPPTLASAITGPIATCLFRLEMNGAAISSGMGTCGLVGQIGVYTGWASELASGTRAAITGADWLGLVLISFVLPAVLSTAFCLVLRRIGWIREGDLTLQ